MRDNRAYSRSLFNIKVKMTLEIKWGFSPRNSPQDDTPIFPKFQKLEERFTSFDILKNLELYQKQRIELISKLGFYLTLSKENKYAFICFNCGCGTIPFIAPDLKTAEEDTLEIVFYHFEHCKFINELISEKWVMECQKLVNLDEDVMPFDDYEKKFKQFAKERREEVCRKKGITLEQYVEEKKEMARKQSQALCIVCKKELEEIIFYPCNHFESCIKCAKKSTNCPTCGLPYSGLSRRYVNNDSLTVRAVDIFDIE